ncbi:MAG TPA: type II toxin-antitoxin system VapC family toxin [Bryobacteraceae bacterium]|nr:type II toxin-antitoxin system VapC family toxin [Bryobacteraceae bacterium]
MFLVDTSVWVNHFRRSDERLQQALLDGQVLMHPFVLGEIACGSLQRRSAILSDLAELPHAVSAENIEVLQFLDQHWLFGKGIGWTDAHLLASAVLTRCRLWTSDSRLSDAAASLKLAAHN